MSAKNVKSSAHTASSSNSKVSNKIIATVTSQPITAEVDAGGAMTIPIIRSKDLAKQLPVYADALKRSVDDCLAAENLDSIQLDLEKLLSNVAIRYRALKTEYDNLERDEKKNKKSNSEKGPKSPEVNNTTSNGKRKREECLSTSSASRRKSQYVTSSTTAKHSKYVKVGSSSVSQQNEDSVEFVPTSAVQSGRTTPVREPTTVKPMLPKNDMPNKFWLSIEPYCMPITNEDLRLIDELREQYAGALLPEIPELGPHYSDVWAEEQLKELQQTSSSNSNQRNKAGNNEAAAMLKKTENLMDETITGPLTQRLVTALIEEKLLPPANENQSNNIKNETNHAGTPLRSLSMLRNGIGIEQRIKQELIEQGILEESDLMPNNEEDEIFNEITRLKVELSAVAEHNCSELKRLRETAVEEIKRLEIKRKLDVIDQEIMETYKRTMQSKAKRRPLSVEEQQEIFRLTAEQRSLSDQLEQTEVKPFHYA